VVANATSTLALMIGTSGSIFGYRQHLPAVRTWTRRFLPVSLAGGLLGALLLTGSGDRVFAKLVPFLILFATVLFLSQGLFRKLAGWEATRHPDTGNEPLWGALLFQFGVAVYGGYFGAGIGILMLASLGFIGLQNIHEMNALKTVLGSLINLVAAVWFVAAGLVHWPKAAAMTVGAVAGYYLASHYAQRIPQARVRQIVTLIGFTLAAVTFYKEFVQKH
jgi:uncharacterized membrane protein YfcA